MTETIERLAREAGIEFERDIVQVFRDPEPSNGGHGCTIVPPIVPAKLSALIQFAALVRAEALEEAAQVCDKYAQGKEDNAPYEDTPDYSLRMMVYAKHVRRCAEAIRALASK